MTLQDSGSGTCCASCELWCNAVVPCRAWLACVVVVKLPVWAQMQARTHLVADDGVLDALDGRHRRPPAHRNQDMPSLRVPKAPQLQWRPPISRLLKPVSL